MNFLEATVLMQSGEKVRRKSWRFNDYWHIPKNASFIVANKDETDVSYNATNILATDWEVYLPEKKPKQLTNEQIGRIIYWAQIEYLNPSTPRMDYRKLFDNQYEIDLVEKLIEAWKATTEKFFADLEKS
jgi:hypothetical protein